MIEKQRERPSPASSYISIATLSQMLLYRDLTIFEQKKSR